MRRQIDAEITLGDTGGCSGLGAERFDHVLHGLEKLPGLVIAVDINGYAQVALSYFVNHFDHVENRSSNAAGHEDAYYYASRKSEHHRDEDNKGNTRYQVSGYAFPGRHAVGMISRHLHGKLLHAVNVILGIDDGGFGVLRPGDGFFTNFADYLVESRFVGRHL